MAYSVLITRIKDKKESVMIYKFDFPDDFWWSEGNFACDCNRYLEFERGLGKEPDEKLAKCSNDKYVVEIYSFNGKLLYKEK